MKNRDGKLQDIEDDGCSFQETIIKDVRLAAAYVPYQNLCTILTPIEALKKGTAFPELYSPYESQDKIGSHDEAGKRRGSHER